MNILVWRVNCPWATLGNPAIQVDEKMVQLGHLHAGNHGAICYTYAIHMLYMKIIPNSFSSKMTASIYIQHWYSLIHWSLLILKQSTVRFWILKPAPPHLDLDTSTFNASHGFTWHKAPEFVDPEPLPAGPKSSGPVPEHIQVSRHWGRQPPGNMEQLHMWLMPQLWSWNVDMLKTEQT